MNTFLCVGYCSGSMSMRSEFQSFLRCYMLTVEKCRSDDMDDLDAYMMSIKSGGMNATGKSNVWCTALQIDSET